MALGNKRNENNPFYPPKKESASKEIGITIGVVLVCLILVGVIIKFFGMGAVYNGKTENVQDSYYEAEPDDPVYEDEFSEDVYEEEIIIGGETQEETVTDDTIEKAVVLLPGNPEESMMNYTYVPVVSANATSTISQDDVVNTPIVVFDGLDETSWQEGVDGYGIGEGLIGYFSDPFAVKYIGFKLGNWKNDKYYFGNARPKTMTITLGDFSQQITFTGERRVEWVKIEGTVISDSIQVVINDIYTGSEWEDTCIAEISVYGE